MLCSLLYKIMLLFMWCATHLILLWETRIRAQHQHKKTENWWHSKREKNGSVETERVPTELNKRNKNKNWKIHIEIKKYESEKKNYIIIKRKTSTIGVYTQWNGENPVHFFSFCSCYVDHEWENYYIRSMFRICVASCSRCVCVCKRLARWQLSIVSSFLFFLRKRFTHPLSHQSGGMFSFYLLSFLLNTVRGYVEVEFFSYAEQNHVGRWLRRLYAGKIVVLLLLTNVAVYVSWNYNFTYGSILIVNFTACICAYVLRYWGCI